MDADEALASVELIREQLARSEAVRAWRTAAVCVTAAAAFVGGLVQSRWSLNEPKAFLILWVGLAGACVTVVAAEMIVRCRRASASVLLRDATVLAARQFVPCLVAGALLTLVISLHAPEAIRLLPGLWAIVFGLGVFASRPGLPRSINFVGAYYLLAGVFVIATGTNSGQFEPWPMPLCFGVGQLLTALVLYLTGAQYHAAAD